MKYFQLFVMSLCLVGLIACQTAAEPEMDSHEEHHASISIEDSRPELDLASPIDLDPNGGKEIGFVYETWLSPEQEGGEEEDTPDVIPDVFQSTKESVSRADRPSRGHGVLAFSKDMSSAYIWIEVEDVLLEDVTMFHIHCGLPGQLGPIIVDFGAAGNVNYYFEDGVFAMEITNEDIEAVLDSSEGLVGAFTAGCPIIKTIPMDRVKTIAGMEQIAREGELYFNLHTSGQTYFGDIRGQFRPVTP